MKIVEANNNKLILKETSFDVAFGSLLFFAAGLIGTLNSGNNKSDSNLIIFIFGPILMCAALLYFIYFFRRTTIIFDRNKIVKNILKINRKYSEKIIVDNIDCIEIIPENKSITDFSRKPKNDLFIKYLDGDLVKINYNTLKNKKAADIGYQIASFYNVPMRKG